MTNRRVFLAAIAAGVAGLAATANADILANWTYESPAPSGAGPHLAQAGVFAATSATTGSHVSGSTVFDNPTGNGSFESFSSNNWAVGDYYQFTTSTSGYENIAIQWDQVASNTGPRDFNLQYSTDGSTFFNIGSMYAVRANASPSWSSGSGSGLDTFGPTAGPGALDNQTTIYFRLRMATTTSANGGTVATGGTNRIDNVIITGDVIPAPGALALLGVGGVIAGRRRRA